jgi:hypothetical protein
MQFRQLVPHPQIAFKAITGCTFSGLAFIASPLYFFSTFQYIFYRTFDIDGFAYLVDIKEVIRAEARLGALTKFGRLPLDLKLGDTRKIGPTKLAAYAKKLSAEDKKHHRTFTRCCR